MRTARSAPTILALAAGLAAILTACSSGTPTAAPTTAPTAAATVAITATPATAAPAATVAPIADGTYVSGTIQVADLLALIQADTSILATQRATYDAEFHGHTTDTVTLDLRAGHFTESDGLDGTPMTVGASGTFAFADAHTLVFQEDCCGLSTLTITPQPNGFSLQYKAGAPNAGEDVVGRWLYESSPFTLVP